MSLIPATILTGFLGSGKTTLLKLILGEIQPDVTTPPGKIRQGANLQVAYFDQMRDSLDLDATLEDFISPGSARSQAASATACCWRACLPALPMCWCWMSRPMTLISIR